MRALALLVLVLVAATTTQHLAVITGAPDAITMTLIPYHGDVPQYASGEWILQGLDQDGVVVTENTLDPRIETLDGAMAYAQEVAAPIATPPVVRTVQLIDAGGRVRATSVIGAACGDLICSTGEQCPEDCAVVTAPEVLLDQGGQSSNGWMYLIGACILLLVILIGVLIKHNSQPPAQRSTQS